MKIKYCVWKMNNEGQRRSKWWCNQVTELFKQFIIFCFSCPAKVYLLFYNRGSPRGSDECNFFTYVSRTHLATEFSRWFQTSKSSEDKTLELTLIDFPPAATSTAAKYISQSLITNINHLCAYLCTCIHTDLRSYLRLYLHLYLCTYLCIYLRTYLSTDLRTYLCTYVHYRHFKHYLHLTWSVVYQQLHYIK